MPEKFLLVSLEESQAQQLAEVISNPTCRKILNFLTEKDYATESKISQELNLPLSTVHYNLSKMKEGHLVEVKEFHYSPKGREVDHYQLANKYIIISPKKVFGLKQKLRSILPAGLVVVGLSVIAGLIESMSRGIFAAKTMSIEAAPQALMDNAPMAAAKVAEKTTAISISNWPPFSVIILVGGLLGLVVYLVVELVREKWKR
ncbi:MAG: helix-turn-helix domain-containing protein [Nanoarchaeota archaeon]